MKDFVEDLTESSVPANRKSGPTASQGMGGP